MKKLIFGLVATCFMTLSSFTTITTNVPSGSDNSIERSVFYCLFAQTELTVFGMTIWEAEYGSWEKCRAA